MKKIGLIIFCILFITGCSTNEKQPAEKEDQATILKEYLAKDTCYKYHYETLSKKDKKLYEEIYRGLSKKEKKIKVSSSDEDLLYEMIELVSYDHPELYYYNGTSIYNGEEKSELLIGYIKEERSKKELKQAFKQTLDEVYARIPEGASEYDKVKIVYEYMIERCEYVDGAKNNQNIVSSLVDRQTVCAGYAKGIQYILNEMGIECSYIVGEIIDPEEDENSYHAWNMVEVDGDYYYLDATWGDVVEETPHTCHAYFMMSQAEMLALYVPDMETKETINYNNYFVHNGTYLSSYDELAIANNLMQCYNEGQNIVEIKCSPEVYDNVLYQLTQEGRIFNIMGANGLYYESLNYYALPEMNMIEIILN